jgi:hypothetical protein
MSQFFTKNSVNLLKAVFLVALFFAFTAVTHAANVALTPSTGSYSAGQTFTVTVQALPAGDNINAVESTLNFDPAVLSVVSVSRDGSVFSLWTTEPSFNNAAGTITFGGGSPTPFTANSNILSITFRAVTNGAGSVTFGDTSVLAADGRGTDVFGSATNGSYTVAAATTPTPTPTPDPTPAEETDDGGSEEAIIFGDPPRPPEIGPS